MTTIDGSLLQHLQSDGVSEVMVTAGGNVWVETPAGIRQAGRINASDLADTIERITRAAGRRVDLLSPVVDAALPDGSRACVVLPPVAVGGPVISIRRFATQPFPLSAFADEPTVRVLRDIVRNRRNIVVSGATSSGKTSLLGSLCRAVPARERLVVIEDTAELVMDNPHVVRLQTRPATAEGTGRVTQQDLVRAAMRLRPDRLVVGEVRGGEAIDMMLALTSGHEGSLTTVHARSAGHALDRLVSLALRDNPQFGADGLRELVNNAVDTVVHVERGPHGARRVTQVVDTRA